MDEERFREVLNEIFDERARVSAEVHGEHHAWIQARIEKEKARKEMYAAVAKSAIGWSVPVLMTTVWYFLTHGYWPKG